MHMEAIDFHRKEKTKESIWFPLFGYLMKW